MRDSSQKNLPISKGKRFANIEKQQELKSQQEKSNENVLRIESSVTNAVSESMRDLNNTNQLMQSNLIEKKRLMMDKAEKKGKQTENPVQGQQPRRVGANTPVIPKTQADRTTRFADETEFLGSTTVGDVSMVAEILEATNGKFEKLINTMQPQQAQAA